MLARVTFCLRSWNICARTEIQDRLKGTFSSEVGAHYSDFGDNLPAVTGNVGLRGFVYS